MKKRFSNKTDLILGIILTVVCLVGLYVYNKSYDHQTKVEIFKGMNHGQFLIDNPDHVAERIVRMQYE